MADKGTSFARLAAATANRLRSIQIDFADQPPQDRLMYLDETVQQSLATLGQEERQAFLRELESRFPTWDDQAVVAKAQKGVRESATNESELKDPSFLVRRLVELAKGMSEADRRSQIIEPLAKAGLSKVGEAGLPVEPLASLKKSLEIPAERTLDAVRLVRLIETLCVSVCKLDQIIWEIWKKMGGRREGAGRMPATSLSRQIRQFLIGNEEVTMSNVFEAVEHLRALTAALLSSVSQVGSKFAHGDIARLRPEEIEAVAIHERKMLEGLESASWRKFKQLAPGLLDPLAIERDILGILVDVTVVLMGQKS